MQTKILLALCLVAISQVNAHGAITAVQGSNGMTGEAFGVDQSTPRDGTKRNPFQTDSSIIRDRKMQKRCQRWSLWRMCSCYSGYGRYKAEAGTISRTEN
uniref:Secreted protein n=1 Tax=Phakopsora pachyrhizi TaxID=170000 RepID=A0A0S1MKL8_PHAPC